MSTGLQKLLTWLSPSFPVGAFAWSAGLETAIVHGIVTGQQGTQDWIAGSLEHGTLKTDAIFLSQAHTGFADAGRLAELSELCLALTPSSERRAETTQTGAAFSMATAAWPACGAPLPDPCPYPIAVGALAGRHGINLRDTLVAFLTAAVHGQVSVAVRLVPIGQVAGLSIMAGLEPTIAEKADWCEQACLEDISSVAYGADIAQMQHETLTTRIFRS